jgi:hypothetical protein
MGAILALLAESTDHQFFSRSLSQLARKASTLGAAPSLWLLLAPKRLPWSPGVGELVVAFM